MGLDRLRGLHGAMRDYGIDRCTFPFERNGERFHVFFFTDRDPFGLMFGHVSGQFSFSVDVLPAIGSISNWTGRPMMVSCVRSV